MEEFLNKCIELGTQFGGRLIGAIVALIVGYILVCCVKKLLVKSKGFKKLDKTVQSFLKSSVTVVLYLLLLICVIGILGIPMASVVAVLASCGLAIGLALQGALSNLAGGLMVMIFKPFSVDDYVAADGVEGSIKNISVFYTTLLTIDNKRVTVPNGDLMNSVVTNFSAEDLRRVDLDFKITSGCDLNLAKGLLLKAAEETKGVLGNPAPFARMSSVDDHTFVLTVRAWCESAQYWDVYFDLLENCSNALGENGIESPEEKVAVRLVNEDK